MASPLTVCPGISAPAIGPHDYLEKLSPWVGEHGPKYSQTIRLGKGSYGEVWSARSTQCLRQVALKICGLQRKDGQRSLSLTETAHREIVLAKHMQAINGCEFISPLREAFYDSVKQRVLSVWDLADRSLLCYLRHYDCVTDETAQHFIVDILSGVTWLHGHRLLHNDIKPSNVLLRVAVPGTHHRAWQAKLTDFGSTCCSILPLGTVMVTTVEYAAPEVLRAVVPVDLKDLVGRASEDHSGSEGKSFGAPPWYTPASDLWSVGVILVELLSETPSTPRIKRHAAGDPTQGQRSQGRRTTWCLHAAQELVKELDKCILEGVGGDDAMASHGLICTCILYSI